MKLRNVTLAVTRYHTSDLWRYIPPLSHSLSSMGEKKEKRKRESTVEGPVIDEDGRVSVQ